MKLTQTPTSHKRAIEVPGLVTCVFTHDIKSTTADITYTGPKISRAVWSEVLAFFRWTYVKWKSESQVRLYVNPTTREWKAWAYPQEADTGMSARELTTDPAFATQRAQFGAGWEYYGTVHHHCSAGAFQSGTDETNEKGQDGIHITIGYLDKDKYDIHSRFYLSGNKFDPKLSDFFDINEQIERVPEELRPLMDVKRIAETMMTTPPPLETVINEAWVANVIVRAPVVSSHTYHGGSGHIGYYNGQTNFPGQNSAKEMHRAEMIRNGYEETKYGSGAWVKTGPGTKKEKGGKKFKKGKAKNIEPLFGVENEKRNRIIRCVNFVYQDMNRLGVTDEEFGGIIGLVNKSEALQSIIDTIALQEITWADFMEELEAISLAEEVKNEMKEIAGAKADQQAEGGGTQADLEQKAIDDFNAQYQNGSDLTGWGHC